MGLQAFLAGDVSCRPAVKLLPIATAHANGHSECVTGKPEPIPNATLQFANANLQCRNTPQEAPRRYSADDAEDMSDEDDGFDEFTWDVAANSNAPRSNNNRSIAKTPGRPPPHRNQRRARHGHARKN